VFVYIKSAETAIEYEIS